jgi:hypothetical protein
VAGLYDDMVEIVRPYANVACDDMAVVEWKMWSNRNATHGIIFGQWYGATWPSHGLPRGTPLLAIGLLSKFYGFHGGRTPDLLYGSALW